MLAVIKLPWRFEMLVGIMSSKATEALMLVFTRKSTTAGTTDTRKPFVHTIYENVNLLVIFTAITLSL